jgi:hypothetical protein
MNIWRIAAILVWAFPAVVLAQEPVQVMVTRTLSFEDVRSGISDSYYLFCPDGMTPVSRTESFLYPSGISITAENGYRDIVYGDDLLQTGARFRFSLPPKGNWSEVVLYVVCIKLPSATPPPIRISNSITPFPGSNIFSGGAFCPSGLVVLGGGVVPVGGAWSPYEETANSTTFDPFLLPAVSGPPIQWDVYGTCPGCQSVNIFAYCVPAEPAPDLISGKRVPADGLPTPAAAKSVATKATVAPGAAGTVTATCPAGMLSTAAGYVASDATNIRLLDLSPLTPGTPYNQRPDGTYEAPNGWSATILNTGAASNQIGVTAICVAAASPSTTVFEFYNTTLKHYFRTAEAAEATAIDGGAAGPGWVRTGLNFTAYVAGIGPGNDVCRFYNPVANTHFYTADPAECTQVKLPNSGWRYEGLSFRAQLRSTTACPQGTIPVYRNYNNRFAFNDSNHRFTTSLSVYNDMIAQGWLGEGVVMCALA